MNNPLRSNAGLTVAISMVIAISFVAFSYNRYVQDMPAIKIGVLHSLSGTMAISEAPLVDVLRMAVEEANRSGGVNGAKIEMIVSDCRSDADYCAQQAEKLIAEDKVQALFGCWDARIEVVRADQGAQDVERGHEQEVRHQEDDTVHGVPGGDDQDGEHRCCEGPRGRDKGGGEHRGQADRGPEQGARLPHHSAIIRAGL